MRGKHWGWRRWMSENRWWSPRYWTLQSQSRGTSCVYGAAGTCTGCDARWSSCNGHGGEDVCHSPSCNTVKKEGKLSVIHHNKIPANSMKLVTASEKFQRFCIKVVSSPCEGWTVMCMFCILYICKSKCHSLLTYLAWKVEEAATWTAAGWVLVWIQWHVGSVAGPQEPPHCPHLHPPGTSLPKRHQL